jgi:hypothetical protein
MVSLGPLNFTSSHLVCFVLNQPSMKNGEFITAGMLVLILTVASMACADHVM